jgi:hypothetical protein
MYSDGRTVLGHAIQVFDATGAGRDDTFASHADNGTDQATLLIATAQAEPSSVFPRTS